MTAVLADEQRPPLAECGGWAFVCQGMAEVENPMK